MESNAGGRAGWISSLSARCLHSCHGRLEEPRTAGSESNGCGERRVMSDAGIIVDWAGQIFKYVSNEDIDLNLLEIFCPSVRALY